MRAKLREVKTELMGRRHLPVPEQGRWLAGVVRGHLAYFAVPGNSPGGERLPDPGDMALVSGASASQPAHPPDPVTMLTGEIENAAGNHWSHEVSTQIVNVAG